MKSVLAVADGGPALEATILAAGHIATLCQGLVEVMHIRDALSIHDTAPAAFMIEGATEAIIQEGENTAAQRAGRALSFFEQLAGTLPKPRFLEFAGDEAEIVIERGRLCDVIVVGRPGSDPVKPEPAHVPAAIFESARPVVVVPPGWRPAALRHAVIAWNGSSQAARAVGYAVPLLLKSERTTVLTATSGDAPDPMAIIDYLGRNGIAAQGATFDIGSGSARSRGRTLLAEVDAHDADLLVMGAYGQQGVLRFLGLGGATGKVISSCKVPVLVAH